MSNDVRVSTIAGKSLEDRATTVTFLAEQAPVQSVGGAMSYFYATYGEVDHFVRTIRGYVANVAPNPQATGLSAEITASMSDDSSNDAAAVFTAAFPAQLG